MEQKKNNWAFKAFSLIFGLLFLSTSIYNLSALFTSNSPAPEMVEQLVSDASTALQKRDYKLALTYLNKAKETNLSDPKIHIMLGQVYQRLKNDTEAIDSYKTAVKIQPTNPSNGFVHEQLAIIYSHRNNLKLAEEELKLALKTDPTNLYATNNLAVIYLQRKDFTTAEDILLKAIKAKEDFPDSYRNLGLLYKEKADKQKAARYLQKYVALAPEAPDAGAIKALLKSL